jgi:hypothetical protein
MVDEQGADLGEHLVGSVTYDTNCCRGPRDVYLTTTP